MKMLSYWEKNSWNETYDMLVIGGGITGYSAAVEFKTYRPDLRVAIIEQSTFETAASTKNAGFACFGSVTEMMADLRTLGEDGLFELVKSRWEGLRLLRMRVGDTSLKYNECGGFEIFKDKSVAEKATEAIPELNQILRPVIGGDTFRLINETSVYGFRTDNPLIENRYEGQLNPSAMMAGLRSIARSMDIELLRATVESIEEESQEVRLKVGELELKSHQVIVAVNGLASRLLNLPVKPARAQVLITEPVHELGWQGTFHMDEGYSYFRNVGNRVLLGGGRNLDKEAETTSSQETTEQIQSYLETILRETILPGRDFKIDQRWAGTMGVGTTREPIVKYVSDRVIAAVRLGGMGVAIGSLVGNQAAHLTIE